MKLTKHLLATTALTVGGTAAWPGNGRRHDDRQLGRRLLRQPAARPITTLHGEHRRHDHQGRKLAEAVAKLRAMNEAGNVTWDLVDVVAADAIRLCDEGLAMEIDPTKCWPLATDGTPLPKTFGDADRRIALSRRSFISTTFGYRTDMVGDTPPTDICDVFDTETYPGKRALEKRPINNMEWALLCDGVAKDDVYDVLATEEGQEQALAKLDTIKDDVIWWSAGADTPQLLADGEVVMGSTYNGRLFSRSKSRISRSACCGTRRCSTLTVGSFQLACPTSVRHACMDYVKFATDTQRLADQAKYISYGPARAVFRTAGRQARRAGHRHGAAHANRSRKRQEHVPLQLRVLG